MKEMATTHYKVRTDTTRFLVPLLNISREKIDTEDFVNAYLCINNEAPEDNEIVLVYKETNVELMLDHRFSYEKKNGFHIYYVTLPKDVYDKFIKGKYSRFKDNEKQAILNFWNLTKHSRMHNILYPENFIFELTTFPSNRLFQHREIWPKPNSFKETFVYEEQNDNNVGDESNAESV